VPFSGVLPASFVGGSGDGSGRVSVRGGSLVVTSGAGGSDVSDSVGGGSGLIGSVGGGSG
jgi:hypothetical protein